MKEHSPRIDFKQYRSSPAERARLEDLLRLLPCGHETILEIGSRDAFHTQILANHFQHVTALDLALPEVRGNRITPVRGDVTKLNFPDNSFDCVLCAEVLEHVPAVDKAAAEIVRVCRNAAVIGVPYREDTRVWRTTCRSCGHKNPPYGHVNSFDENRLASLFQGMKIETISHVGSNKERTNAVSRWLNDLGGNPWGTYSQEEPCNQCGASLSRPERRSVFQKVVSRCGMSLYHVQQVVISPRATWIHVLFRKAH